MGGEGGAWRGGRFGVMIYGTAELGTGVGVGENFVEGGLGMGGVR